MSGAGTLHAHSSLKTVFRMRSRLRGWAEKESTMPCLSSGKVFDLSALTVLKHPELLAEKMVSANKLSVTKFVCPEVGCGKSVDVYFLPDEKVRIRHHAAKGERVSMIGGARGTVSRTVSLTSLAELHKKQQDAFAAQMTAMIGKAEDAVKSADVQIEAQLALIKQAETRIAQIQSDKIMAEEILTNPEYTQYRKAV